MQTNLPVFRVKESSVRRRFSDFEWLRNELERDSKIVVPALPSKAIKRQLPFRGDDGDSSHHLGKATLHLFAGIFEEDFIEERRAGLEGFINKIAGHPLAQNERCLHMFLQVSLTLLAPPSGALVVSQFQDPVQSTAFRFGFSNLL